jgi:hypothetical protein
MPGPTLTVPPFEKFLPAIKAMPPGRQLSREELLVDALRLYRDRNVEVYYMPTDGLNPLAKLMLLGITPGWTQRAFRAR